VGFSVNGKWLASGADDGSIKIWNADTGAIVRTLLVHTDGITSLSFSADGKWLASASQDKTVKVWGFPTG
jgi:WD40 repeat protein